MNYKFYTYTDKGEFRQTNQDRYYAKCVDTAIGKAFLGIVSDGMGGHSCGELASSTVVSYFSEWFEKEFCYIMNSDNLEDTITYQWQGIIDSANAQLRRISRATGEIMGTTLSVLMLANGSFYIAQIGDSRVYMGGAGFFAPLTRDHSYVMEMAERGLLTMNEAMQSGEKNILTRCIGIMEKVYADYYTGKVQRGDYFFICSDGFCSGLDREELYALSAGALNSRKSLEKAAHRRRLSGERDNITAVSVSIV